jgi:hypothetical protein
MCLHNQTIDSSIYNHYLYFNLWPSIYPSIHSFAYSSLLSVFNWGSIDYWKSLSNPSIRLYEHKNDWPSCRFARLSRAVQKGVCGVWLEVWYRVIFLIDPYLFTGGDGCIITPSCPYVAISSDGTVTLSIWRPLRTSYAGNIYSWEIHPQLCQSPSPDLIQEVSS